MFLAKFEEPKIIFLLTKLDFDSIFRPSWTAFQVTKIILLIKTIRLFIRIDVIF